MLRCVVSVCWVRVDTLAGWSHIGSPLFSAKSNLILKVTPSISLSCQLVRWGYVPSLPALYCTSDTLQGSDLGLMLVSLPLLSWHEAILPCSLSLAASLWP